MAPKLRKAAWNDRYANRNCNLPHGLTTQHIKLAIRDVYRLLYNIDTMLLAEGFDPMQTIVLGNTLSGMLSEIIVKRIVAHCHSLARNLRVGGHPDLIPANLYPGNEILKGSEGIEVKTSKQPGGWQAHNPEACRLMVFRYVMEEGSPSPAERQPIEFVQILYAQLNAKDWSLAERGAQSRRTRTTSINERGMHKLRSFPVYQNPAYIVAPDDELRAQYRALHAKFTGV